jgi:hypothetical protein
MPAAKQHLQASKSWSTFEGNQTNDSLFLSIKVSPAMTVAQLSWTSRAKAVQ